MAGYFETKSKSGGFFENGGSKSGGGGHSLFHNLLSDVVSTAKGIGPGLVTTFEHPVRAAKGMVKSEEAMYSPLIHGQFGTFWNNFHSHPLGPLLDALTLATAGAGGIGLAAKAGESAGLLGEGAADFARVGTRFTVKDLPTSLGDGVRSGEIARHYSPNIARRYLIQKPTEKAFEKVGKLPIGRQLFGPEGLHDMTALGRGNRMLAQRGSAHAAGTAFAQNRELGAVHRLLKGGGDPAETNAAISGLINNGLVDGVFAHSIKADATKAKHLGGQDWSYIKRVHPLDPPKEANLAAWAEHIKTKTPFVLTKDPAKAMKDEHGQVTIVHQKLPEMASKEAANGLRALDVIYKQPTKLWKYLVLAQAPRYFVNNTVGNSLMLMASTRPDRLVRGIYHAVAAVHGVKAAERSARKVGDTMGAEQTRLMGTAYHKWYAGPNAGPGTELARVGGRSAKSKLGRAVEPAIHRAAQGTYGVTEKVAYRATHMAGVNAAMMETPQFRKLFTQFRDAGKSRSTAFQMAFDRASEDPAVRGFVSKRAADWAGQYHHSTPLENAVRNIVPFYSWDRHALRFAREQALGRPGSTDVLTHMGAEGNLYTQKKLGNLPDFMQGAVPLGKHGGILGAILGGVPAGREKLLLTNSLNPLSAAAEDANALAALGGQQVGSKSEALGFQINPIIAGAISSLTGQALGSGAPVHYKGGVIGGAATNTFGAVPFAKIIQSLIAPQPSTTSKGKPTLYTHDTRQQLQSLFGLSIRDASREAAAIMLAKEAGKKKKKTYTFAGG